ncbi:NAD-binding protein [Magnetovirga frankeli]|uniref:potassium channel family protein n=1 Tax=Magnetovirga frankeli TaxID=947516 RepID=UPI001293DA7C|nr:NAD-binding protein [gamma proteobacterium SS-5]
MLDNIFFMILRRMRTPLLSLVVVFSIALLGLVLIPGIDGKPLSFFHGLYFVSYMATTIGFGEIPLEFSNAQRLWVIFAIYATVIVWLYAIGSVITLLQDRALQQAFVQRRFARQVGRQRAPFYIVCGYGDTGEVLVRELLERGQHAVVMDAAQERINSLRLQGLPEFVPALLGDSARPANLLKAGLRHPLCAGVAALTSDSEVNLKVAISSKLLHPRIKVLCRADSHEIEANMASFGTDHIIDPYDTFALHLATAMQSPGLYLLRDWLTGVVYSPLNDPIYPPKQGRWVLCGFGRFGKVVYRRLRDEGVEITVIEATPDKTGLPQGSHVTGWGTEAGTLQQAGIETAVGLVAGTDNDVNNLSIIMTARELNPELFIIARQNRQENAELFDAVNADILMRPSQIIANRIRMLLATPMLHQFESLALYQDDEWACELISRITALVQQQVPFVWDLTLDEEAAYAVYHHLHRGGLMTLEDLLRNPRNRDKPLACIPLMLRSRGDQVLLPELKTRLHLGDRLLFCAAEGVKDALQWTLQNGHALSYVVQKSGD